MSLENFVDVLPIPSILKPIDKRSGIPFYEVTMKQSQAEVTSRLVTNYRVGLQRYASRPHI